MQKEAMLYEKLNDNKVHCFLCAHHCTITDSHYGFYGVRKNERGTLYTCVYAEAIASHADPIEKKPLYHFLPGTKSFSIATMGCNFHCGFCQNWEISQRSKRDRSSGGYELRPEEVVGEAKKNGCKSISYAYTEPTIFFEYAYDTAQIAKEEGLYNNFVTNGYMTQEALETISPYLDAANVDLKSFSEDFYRNTCKGHLQPVLDSITLMKQLNIWVEITTLLIPGENDSNQALNQITKFIAALDNSIPWHISKFHPDYQFTEHSLTSPETLRKARGIGYSNGLRYIYLGNVQEGRDTRCPHCEEVVIERTHATITENIIESGKCPFCGMVIEGVFN